MTLPVSFKLIGVFATEAVASLFRPTGAQAPPSPNFSSSSDSPDMSRRSGIRNIRAGKGRIWNSWTSISTIVTAFSIIIGVITIALAIPSLAQPVAPGQLVIGSTGQVPGGPPLPSARSEVKEQPGIGSRIETPSTLPLPSNDDMDRFLGTVDGFVVKELRGRLVDESGTPVKGAILSFLGHQYPPPDFELDIQGGSRIMAKTGPYGQFVVGRVAHSPPQLNLWTHEPESLRIVFSENSYPVSSAEIEGTEWFKASANLGAEFDQNNDSELWRFGLSELYVQRILTDAGSNGAQDSIYEFWIRNPTDTPSRVTNVGLLFRRVAINWGCSDDGKLYSYRIRVSKGYDGGSLFLQLSGKIEDLGDELGNHSVYSARLVAYVTCEFERTALSFEAGIVVPPNSFSRIRVRLPSERALNNYSLSLPGTTIEPKCSDGTPAPDDGSLDCLANASWFDAFFLDEHGQLIEKLATQPPG